VENRSNSNAILDSAYSYKISFKKLKGQIIIGSMWDAVVVCTALLQLSFGFCSRKTTDKSIAPSYTETTAAEQQLKPNCQLSTSINELNTSGLSVQYTLE